MGPHAEIQYIYVCSLWDSSYGICDLAAMSMTPNFRLSSLWFHFCHPSSLGERLLLVYFVILIAVFETMWLICKCYRKAQVLLAVLWIRNVFGFFFMWFYWNLEMGSLLIVGSPSLFKTIWIIIKITCLNCQNVIYESCHGFQFMYLHSVPILLLCLKVCGSANKISSLQKRDFLLNVPWHPPIQ